MDMDTYHIWSLTVAILTLIATVLGLFKIYNKIQNKTTFYGNEAKRKYNELKDQLIDDNEVNSYEFEGGKNKIFPQIKFEPLDQKRMEVDPKFKKFTEIVTYHFINENKKRWVKVWYIK